jgi:hypothetical protein
MPYHSRVRVTVDLDLPAFEQALTGLLPSGFTLEGLQLDASGLRLDVRAPMVGRVVLTADVLLHPARLSFQRFDIEGAGMAKPFALGALRRRLADLDTRRGTLRVWGESDGERAHLSWDEA